MALWKDNGGEDEFFGDETDTLASPAEVDRGLPLADSNAAEERFRTFGYHETYDTHKEVRLQEGFETGYKASFDAAYRIGRLLGKATAEAKGRASDTAAEATREDTAEQPKNIQIARLVREYAQATHDDAQALQQLEEAVARVENR